MSGIPNGFILSDGSPAHTVTGDGTAVDITGWSLNTLIVTPPSTATGVTVDLTVTATSTESDATFAQQTATLEITVLPSAGNDTIVFDTLYKSIDGGAGTDTLVLTHDTNIDFSNLGNVIHNIEAIDLGHGGAADAHSLTNLSAQDVMDMTDSAHTLTIFGDSADSVTLVNPTGADANHTWTQTGNNVIENGHTLDIYHNGDSTVTLKIEDTTTHAIV
jgi:hypothetical protein